LGLEAGEFAPGGVEEGGDHGNESDVEPRGVGLVEVEGVVPEEDVDDGIHGDAVIELGKAEGAGEVGEDGPGGAGEHAEWGEDEEKERCLEASDGIDEEAEQERKYGADEEVVHGAGGRITRDWGERKEGEPLMNADERR